MERQKKLDALLQKLSEQELYEIKEDLEEFLQTDNDLHTQKLQEAISDKLDGVPFPYVYFDDFLSDYLKNNPTDPAGHHDFKTRIYGDI